MPKHGGNPTDSHNETDVGHLSDELEIELAQLTMMRLRRHKVEMVGGGRYKTKS